MPEVHVPRNRDFFPGGMHGLKLEVRDDTARFTKGWAPTTKVDTGKNR